MRYEDTSSSVHGAAGNADARDDADTLANGSNGPASGNVITGAGTTTGKAGADSPATGHVVAVHGAGGTDSSNNGASLHVDGRYGTLVMDEHGNYKYVADGHAPASFRDLFQYTLADGKGGQSVADLVISRGGEIKVSENAQQIVPGPDGVVTLPAGVDLSDVHVVGRNLVVDMPDGSQIVIVNGAVFVPQLVLGGVEVPSTNLAALLIDSEPRPAAGPPPSSGGDFADPVPPLDPGVPLGDLIPPTVIPYVPPEFHEVNGIIDRKPTIEIEPDGQPASVAAVDDVNEKGLPGRNEGEPAGSGEIADGNSFNNSDPSETTAGTIIIDSQDTPNSVSINGEVVTGVIGQQIAGDFGTLTITGFSGQNILYSYTLADNTSGDNTHDDFLVTVTDHDGDQASATLVINIIDDVPTARPDTDTVAAGTYGPETGNVISGVGTTSGSAGADTVGADNAHMTAVTGFGATTGISGGWTVIGHYGVLTIHTDGGYSYVRNPGTPGGVSDVFNYTLTDGDGDTSTTTLTINIGDATPHTGENPLIRFDDDALAGGNPGTPAVGDDSPDTVNATGTLAGGGGDGPLTFAVQTTGAPSGFSYVSGGAGIVLIQQNGHTVMTVTVGADGSYSVVQNAPIDHSAGGQENNQIFTINYTVTDQDNDSAPGTFTINVDDDTPIVGITESEPSLTVDETNLSVNATVSFAGAFTHSFGADGPAASNSLVYSLGISAPGADSGLIDVATGQHVLLSVNGSGVVEGRTAIGGDLVFTVSVNSAGDVTLDQIRAVQHPDASNPDDNVTLASNDLVTLSLTATDHDADSASRTLNIGQHLNFHDDGPSIQASQTQPDLTVDETVLATNASASFAGVFTSSFGADGAGTVAYHLGISAPGADSGLIDTLSGQHVLLSVNGSGVVEGRTAIGGDLVFTVSVDASGNVSLDQIRAVVHADTSNPDDSTTLSADSLVTLTGTITDKDGDQASATANIGTNLHFEDDGPSISPSGQEPSLTVDETILATNASASFAGAFTPLFGSDGPLDANHDGVADAGAVTYALTVSAPGADSGLIDVATGQHVLLSVNGSGVVEGRTAVGGDLVFTVSVNAAGTVTLDQVRAVVHPDATNPDDSVTLASDNLVQLTATAHDGDGDTATAALNIGQNLNFEDDGPSINANGEQPTLTVDETNLATNATASFAGVFNGNFGADGAGTVGGYQLGISAPGADSGLIDVATGQHVLLSVNGSGVVEGRTAIGGDLVFTVSVNAAGDVTLDQVRAVSHPDASNPDDNVTLSADNLVTLSATITDRDGDTASATANIGQNLNFHDDGPSVSANAGVQLDDDALAGGNPGGIGDDSDSTNASGTLGHAYGADGAGSIAYLTTGAPAGFSYALQGNGDLWVMQGATHVLTLTVNSSTGAYTVTQVAPIDHPAGSDENNVSFTIGYNVTDRDGDTATGSITVNVDDDTPTVSANAAVQLDDDALAGGNPGGIGDDANATNTSGTLAHSYGADGAGSVAYLTTGAPAGFSYALQGNGDLWVMQGATHVLTLTVNSSTGAYTVSQVAPIDHPAGSDENNVSFTISYNVTDHDGDTATGSIVVNVDDDTPTVSANAAVQLDDDALAGGNPGGVGDDANATNTSGTLAHSYGADGAGSMAYLTTGAPAGFSYALQGNGDLWVMQGATHVLTLTLNNSTGAYTVTQVAPISHPAGSDENNVSFTISYNVTDHDGDSATGSITVNVDDDTPTANNDTDVTSNVTDTADGNVISGVGTTEGAANHDSPGADGFGSITNLVGFNGSTDSNSFGGFDVNGQYGTLHMDVNGNYTYTRTGGPGGATDSFTYTYVDGDGDPVSATLTITIADNTPVAGTVNVGLDDDALAGGNAGGTGDDPDSVNATGTLPGSGGDAPLTFGVLLTGAPAGFSYVSGGAGIVLVQQNGHTVLTVTVNSTTGAYSVVQNAPIDHSAGGDENNQNFAITYTVTDSDTDVANGTINISVDDDTPTVSANAGVQLDDDALAGGNAGGIGDDANATNTSGTLAHSYGADGAGSIAYLTTGAPAGFSYALQGNGDLWVMQGANHVLTLTVNSTSGAYAVTQVAPIDHPAGSDENNVSFTISYNVTDHDGDSATGSITVNVDDDTPTVSANAAVQLDDDALAGGNAGGIGDVNPDTANTSGTLGHSFGADGAGSMAYLTTGAPAGFTYALQGNGDLWIMQGANHVITLTINSTTGAYTVTQVAPIDHPAGSDENDVSFTVSYNVTDHDGDTATGSIVINVDDDTPTVSANAAVQLDDDALAGGNAGGTGDVNPDTANTSGTLGHSYGADGAGSMAYLTTGAPAGFTYALQGNGDLWVMQGATHVITLTLNSTTGAYTVTQVAPIDHPAGGNENDVAFTISYNVTDHDGDTVTGSIVVNVDDDTPTVSANAAVQLDDDALAGGNPGGIGDVNPDTANLTGTLAHSYGADGAGSVALLGTGAPAGFTYDTSTPGTLLIKQGATTVITVTVNSSTGAYTVVQNAPIAHAAGGDENDQAFTISYNVTDHDGDSATGSIVINVDDDTPTATIVATGANTSIDESVGVQADSNDTTSAGVIALFSGVATPGSDTDLPQYATNASAIVASTGSSYGADGAGSTAYSLNVSVAGVDSGLNTTDGHDILLFKEGNLIVGRVSGGADNGKAAFAIAIDNTGHISTVEYLSIQHPDGTNPDDMVSIANGAVTATVTLTDSDGDAVSSTPLGIGSHIQFQDSGPVMTAAQNINIQNSGTVSNSGQFAFNLGADGPNITTNDVITNVTGSATVNGVAVQNWTLTAGAETATTANYSFSFDYGIGGGNTAHETGTLVFDKVAGTYTVDLADPIQGVTTILQTATGTLFQGYEFGTSNVDSSQPAISVTQIQDLAGTANDIYVQFTSVAEPSSGTGDNNLEVTNWVPGADNPAPINGAGDDKAWNAGQVFNQVDSWVSTSNSANGVAGDTIQGGEVLDFSLVQGNNPTGNLANPATYAQASSMFLKFDGIGSGEDMIIVLKLYDPTTNSYTTRAIMVENGDIQKGPGTGPGIYSGITLDQNDGLVIIESNDYNLPGEHWVIVGAQIAGSDEGITGTAIDLNPALGAGGDSVNGAGTGFDVDPLGFQSDTNDGPFKISSIGFTTVQTTPQPAHLDFNVTVADGDGDSITQAIAVDVTSAANSASAATIPAGNTTVAAAPLSTKGTVAVADAYPTTQHSDAQQQTTTNSNAVLVGALAAAGLAGADSVAASTLHVDLNSSVSSIATVSYHAQNLAPISIDAAGGHSVGDLMPSISSGGFAGPIAQAPHFGDAGQAQGLSLIGATAQQGHAPTELVQAMQAPAHDGQAFAPAATAASIVMPAAQQLAGVAGGVGGAQHNQVVGQILADALHGGGSQPNIDGMLSALPGQPGHGYGVALASGFGSAVSNGDSHGFGDFTGASAGFTMEHMMILHQAAALAHG